jgi:acyl-CoA reductase-like NAD-dependent aldehyde dehydrogenase
MATYVQSGSQSHAEEVAARIEAGMVYLNGASEDSKTLWRLQNVGQRARAG